MFDEYFNPLPSAVSPVQVAATPRPVDLADLPVSTSIDQDAPSTSIPSTQDQEQSLIISKGVKESPKTPYFVRESLNLKPQSSYYGVVCKKEMDSNVMLIELIKDDEYPSGDELNKDDDVGEEEFEGNNFEKFPTCSELAYYKYLMHDPYLSEIVRDPIIERGNP
ncbi:hypothetical protein Tco_0769436 [Tanacetum coccineum]|uniref:Uncharacterized protein n=1 Tax=Tanacetum coccineum TaxID=301880 RepID=A0ABQ4ZCN1_9ASTR